MACAARILDVLSSTGSLTRHGIAMQKKTIVLTSAAPAAVGSFSQAVGFGGVLYCSAQRGVDAHTGHLGDGVDEQTSVAMENVRSLLNAAGLDFSHVLRAVIYVKNLVDLPRVEMIYSGYFDENPPARSIVEVSRLSADALVSIEITAAFPIVSQHDEEEEEEKEKEPDTPLATSSSPSLAPPPVHERVDVEAEVDDSPEDDVSSLAPGTIVDPPRDEPI